MQQMGDSMNFTRRKVTDWAGLLGSVSCAGLITVSPMGSTLAAESERTSEFVGLESVVVTAQRREENSQDVPIAISTISGEDAALRGAVSIQTLSATVPGLSMAVTTSNTNTFIRGVGSTSASSNNEPSAATYVDGVYMPSSFALSSFFFNNIERLEVLKGPQGTLFGRNSTAGVIQIVTPDPKHELGGNLSLGYGNYETVYANGYVTGGITDNLAADVAVNYEDQDAGWGYNPTYQKEIFVHENVAVRSKWVYTSSDSTKVSAAFDYANFKSDGSNFQMLPGSINSLDHVTTYPGRFNAVGEVNVSDAEQYGASVRIDQDLGALHGVSITSYRNVSGNVLIDNDVTPALITTIESYNDADYVTQEFQLSGDSGRIDWLVGAFFYGNEVDGASPRRETGSRVNPGQYREIYGRQKTRSMSAFGQGTAEIFTDTKLTLGLRYTDETLKADGRYVNQAGQVYSGPFSDEVSFDPWTWRVALDHQFTPDVLGYVSWNRGFKSGGYNLNSPGSPSFLPEHLDAYEVGLKSELLDSRVRLNLAAFYYDYRDLQVTIVPGGGTQIFTNAAAARNYGLDASLDFAATDNLTLSLGVALLDAKYEDYPNARGYTSAGVAVPVPNAKGRDLPNAPPFSGFVSANYRLPTAIGDFKGTVSLSYNDRTYITAAQESIRPSYELLSGSVEWRSPTDGSLGVRLWGRNLTDTYYPNASVETATGWYQTPAAPRTYGLTLLKDF